MTPRRAPALVGATLLTTVALTPVAGPSVHAAGAPTAEPLSGVVLDWERTAMQTIYPATPIPTGVPLLGYTSVAMYDALERAERKGQASPSAAVAQAAHDVLVHYFSGAAAGLDTQLAQSLASIPDGPEEERGRAAGARAAERMVTTHEDPRVDAGHGYDLEPGPGVWTAPPTGMLAPWLGYLDELVVNRPIKVDGPDPITSRAYATDYQEVKRVGAESGADRTPFQTETALFFNSNSATMVGQGLIALLEEQPLSLHETVRMFAVMHGAMTDAVITCWRLKRDVGFWRPFQAIQAADTDGNPATVPDRDWRPLVPNPPYADYVSGHACLTGPAVETVRMFLGEETELTLRSVNPAPIGSTRTYATLSAIEFDAFHARIWGGLHFRDAMEDGYRIGHIAAQRAMHALP